ncbi:MAG: NADH-quinone oxidoreductase subunit J [Actinomycetota bacterium]
MGERITFAVAAAAALISAGLVITLKSAFRAAVSLIVTLISVAVLFLIQSAQFVAAIQVIVYAGAIVVLFLFVIAYLGERRVEETVDPLGRMHVFGWLTALGLGGFAALAIANSRLPGLRDDPRKVGNIGGPEAIGQTFLNHQLVAFEATSLVLLVAAVGAVVLAKRAGGAGVGR